MSDETAGAPPVRAITKSVAVDRPHTEVFAYLADAANWPQWSVVNVLAIEADEEQGWWRLDTPHGPGRLRIRADAATGVLDHDWRDPQAAWTVPARVVPNGRGAQFLITFFQPPVLDDEEFERQADLVDTELATLKRVLEDVSRS